MDTGHDQSKTQPEAGGPTTRTPPTSDTPGLSKDALEKVRTRDPQALAEFFECYFPRVYGLACRLLGDQTTAEDVTQDVFFKVHRAADQLDSNRDPVPWLMTVTHNVCRDYWRSRGYKMAQKSSSMDEHVSLFSILPAPGDTPEQAALRKERDRTVQNALMKLPESLRTVVVLHDYRSLKHEEIAVITGASYAAVRKRYSRALAKLSEYLKDIEK